MGRMEGITRTERQRTYSEAEKATVVANGGGVGHPALRGVTTARNSREPQLQTASGNWRRCSKWYAQDDVPDLLGLDLEYTKASVSPASEAT